MEDTKLESGVAAGSLTNSTVKIDPDKEASSISLSATGEVVALGARKGLYLVPVTGSSGVSTRFLPHNGKWDVNSVQFSPHVSHASLAASVSNQQLQLWDTQADSSGSALQHSIQAHTRVVSDVSWSPFDPNLVLTCSADTYIHLWDIRQPQKPSKSFCGWTTGVSQVKWNRINPMTIASAHDGEVRVWDIRNRSGPTTWITAHMQMIYGLDWNHMEEHELVTCAQDRQVKFWNIKTPRESTVTIMTGNPVWRAKYTPFGQGIVTVSQRGDNTLPLWSCMDLSTPVKTFIGHKDQVRDVDWRCSGPNSFELVSFGKDLCLRLWAVEPEVLDACGHGQIRRSATNHNTTMDVAGTAATGGAGVGAVADGRATPSNLSLGMTSSLSLGATTSTPGSGGNNSLGGSTPQSNAAGTGGRVNSGPEISLVEELFKLEEEQSVKILEQNHSQRYVIVEIIGSKTRPGGVFTGLSVSFPNSYPHSAPPAFDFYQTSLPIALQGTLRQILADISNESIQRSQPCLVRCVRALVSHLKQWEADTVESEKMSRLGDMSAGRRDGPGDSITLPDIAESVVPFPRIASASFSQNGTLVVFNNIPGFVVQDHRRHFNEKSFPTSMSLASPGVLLKQGTTNSLFQDDMYIGGPGTVQAAGAKQTSSQRGGNQPIANLSDLRADAERIRSSTTVRDSQHRAAGGSSGGVFSTSGLASQYNVTVALMDVDKLLPLSRDLATKYTLNSDIVAICNTNAAAAKEEGRYDLVKLWSLLGIITEKKAAHGPATALSPSMPWSQHPLGRMFIKQVFEQYSRVRDIQTLAMLTCVLELHDRTAGKGQSQALLGGENMSLLHHHVELYVDILYRWGMFEKRAEVVKVAQFSSDVSWVESLCDRCGQELRYDAQGRSGARCTSCNRFGLTCSICHVSVRGVTVLCQQCHHGGHLAHIQEWFSNNTLCPEGCDCACTFA